MRQVYTVIEKLNDKLKENGILNFETVDEKKLELKIDLEGKS